MTYRLLGATALGLSVLIGVLGTATLAIQRGLSAAQDAPSIALPTVIAFVAAAAAGLVGWAIQPNEPHRVTVLSASETPAFLDDENAVWTQRTQIARAGAWVLGLSVAVMVAITAGFLLTGGPYVWPGVLLLALTVLMAGLVSMSLAFHVRVDAAGLTVTSVVGRPRIHIPLDQIERVENVEVNPMGEFGGWGMRWAPGGGLGVVLHTGPGIRVERTGGKVFTVTVDDAPTGAALLNALRERTGGTPR